MVPDVVARLGDLAETILTTTHAHALTKAVRQFVVVLQTVPDHPASSLSEDAVGTVRQFSEQMIQRIEDRVAESVDGPAVQLELVEGVYDIRRSLEDIDRWRRHYLGPL